MSDLRLRYAPTSRAPTSRPTDIVQAKSSDAIVQAECIRCGWRSQPFQFKTRTAILTFRSHFLGFMQDGKTKSWRCKRQQ